MVVRSTDEELVVMLLRSSVTFMMELEGKRGQFEENILIERRAGKYVSLGLSLF